ncbi:hypothetical protein LINGRAHAP2_LOCUS36121 [Linum grandiflorum]
MFDREAACKRNPLRKTMKIWKWSYRVVVEEKGEEKVDHVREWRQVHLGSWMAIVLVASSLVQYTQYLLWKNSS